MELSNVDNFTTQAFQFMCKKLIDTGDNSSKWGCNWNYTLLEYEIILSSRFTNPLFICSIS